MARLVLKRPGTKKQPELQPEKVEARISLGSSKSAPTYYANYAEVTQTQHDIGICFAEIPVRFSPEEKKDLVATRVINAEPAAQIILAPTLLPGLIKALQVQRASYEESFGPIRDDEAVGKGK